MRMTSAEIAAELKKQETKPTELYQILFKDQSYYYAQHDEDIYFFDENGQPQKYEALGITRTSIKTDIESRVEECNVTLNNVTNKGTRLLSELNFSNAEMRIIKVFRNLLDDPENQILIFEGELDAPMVTKTAFQISVRSKFDIFTAQTPKRRYTRLCSWKFGGQECGVNLQNITATTTIAGISGGRTITLNSRNDPVNYWMGGIAEIATAEGQRERRLIIASDGASLQVDFPFESAGSGDQIIIRRGCNRTYTQSCKAKYNNEKNYGGFLAVPKRPDDSLRKPWADIPIDDSKKGKGKGK